MPDKQHLQRQQILQNTIKKSGIQAAAFNPGPDLNYLTGLDFHLMERPVIFILPQDGSPVMVLPELESAKMENLPYPIRPFFFNENPDSWTGIFKAALQEAGVKKGKMGVIPRRLRLLELNYLQAAAPELELVSAQDLISRIRMVKDSEEVEKMQEAVRIAECSLAAILSSIKPGLSEKELASRLVSRLLQQGSDPELPFFPIVSFGENSANPHASPGDRILQEGDLVLIDWGAAYHGYYSDITRVFALGDLHPEIEKIAQFVREANLAARAAVKPGVSASEVDRAARQVISEAGYGEFFTHRTGHGLGREAHEEPYISQFDETILEPGMTFTIEPGIYLPNRGGVRIEDDILVTEDGGRSLTNQPRVLSQLLPEDLL
ncbi:MAG: Xaa-Pro peptidase family protein [Anaerolineales bacterium]